MYSTGAWLIESTIFPFISSIYLALYWGVGFESRGWGRWRIFEYDLKLPCCNILPSMSLLSNFELHENVLNVISKAFFAHQFQYFFNFCWSWNYNLDNVLNKSFLTPPVRPPPKKKEEQKPSTGSLSIYTQLLCAHVHRNTIKRYTTKMSYLLILRFVVLSNTWLNKRLAHSCFDSKIILFYTFIIRVSSLTMGQMASG